MTQTAELETFYGAAIHLLRWWGLRWSVRRLAQESGVSAGSILSFERGKAIPSSAMRRKLAQALGVTPAGLDRLAGAIQRGMIRREEGSTRTERLVSEVAAHLAEDFYRAVVPLVTKLVSMQASGPAAWDEDVLALGPVVRSLDLQELHSFVRCAPSLRRWAFVKVVGEESLRAASVDADRALELAMFALHVAERVAGEEDWVSRVLAWAILGNARRVGSDLAGAEEAFARSARLQSERPPGRLDLPDPWRLLDLEASLRIDLRQISEALRLLDQAVHVAPQRGPIQARLLCKRANALYRGGDLEGSIAALRQGLAYIDPETEPRLCFMLQSNLAERLTETGQTAAAAEMLPELLRLQAHVGNGLNQIRLRWLEGKIDAGLGRIDRAIETLSWVRAAFAKEHIPYDEALAGTELAGLYLEQGRTTDGKRLVLQMEPVFQSQGVPAEAQKALHLFRRAVELETVTVAMVRRVVAYLYQARQNPELRFDP
jgi:tetratricopeptide (TPR) repeat protein/transcriptional regulator with XRE-family HTH domain